MCKEANLLTPHYFIWCGLLIMFHPSTFECLCCRNPSLGVAIKARACKGAGQEWARQSHFMFLKMQESGREWTSTLPSELPLWELEFRWTLESSKSDCKSQNPLDWDVLYIIENLLELRCLKWACMTYLNTYNTSYGQKKGR